MWHCKRYLSYLFLGILCFPSLFSIAYCRQPSAPSASTTIQNRTANTMTVTSPQEARIIKAVLFDLDGTLLDTEALSDRANLKNFDGLLPQHVQEEVDRNDGRLPWEVKKQILGLRASSWVPLLTNYAKNKWGVTTPLSTEEFALGWETNLNSFCEEIVACKGANELVSQFTKMQLPMAIATSSRKASVDKKRKRHETIFQHMATIVCGDDPELKNGKPAPDIYILAAKRLGVDPKECLVFEDAMSGVKAGKSAGSLVVAVPDPRFSAEERADFESMADVVLDDLGQFDASLLVVSTFTQQERN